MTTNTMTEVDRNDTQLLSVDYTGDSGNLFRLVLKTLFLTTITLGIYRFWMKARVRRYYWSAVQPGGHGMEYLGTGMEKFIGFLIAVVFLAVYLGIFQLILTFASLTLFSEYGVNLAFIAVIPLIFYASYRARRYILARTRWRGIRFGAEPAAVGYALRAMGYAVLAIVTLGLLVPLMTFRLEKFATDRTWFGDIKFEQNGKWTVLLVPWLKALGIVLAAMALFGLLMYGVAQSGSGAGVALIPFAAIGLYLAFGFAFVYYGVVSFRVLTNHKMAGNGISFVSKARSGRVFGIYILGIIVMFLVALLFGVVIFGAILALGGSGLDIGGAMDNFGGALVAGNYLAAGLIILVYLLFLLVLGAVAHLVFIQPVLRHYATTVTVKDPHGEIDMVRQRAHDSSVEAEGFADALDVGAAI